MRTNSFPLLAFPLQSIRSTRRYPRRSRSRRMQAHAATGSATMYGDSSLILNLHKSKKVSCQVPQLVCVGASEGEGGVAFSGVESQMLVLVLVRMLCPVGPGFAICWGVDGRGGNETMRGRA